MGLKQGTIISCKGSFLDGDLKELLKKSRAIVAEREKPVNSSDLLLILSQDCDLASPHDNYVEVLPMRAISGRKISSKQQRLRNYRKLQLPYESQMWLLNSDRIAVIRKDTLPLISKTSLLTLDDQNLQMVLDWRVGRYNRRPLPHGFNLVFVSYLRGDPELSTYLEDNRATVFDLYVHVDPMNDENADEYRAIVVAVIDQDCSDAKEVEIREMLAKHWGILHQQDNCLRMGQIDNSFAPKTTDFNLEITARLADFTLLDIHFLSKVTLEFLCYDEPVDNNL